MKRETVGPEDRPLCQDCNALPSVVVYGLGFRRCGACAAAFNAVNHAKREVKHWQERLALAEHEYARERNAECPDDGVSCQQCCPHDERDHGICLDCEHSVY